MRWAARARSRPSSWSKEPTMCSPSRAISRLSTPPTWDKGHGRLERRRYTALSDPDLLACLDPTGAWPGLRSVVQVEAERRRGEHRSREMRYYLSSLPPDAALLGPRI